MEFASQSTPVPPIRIRWGQHPPLGYHDASSSFSSSSLAAGHQSADCLQVRPAGHMITKLSTLAMFDTLSDGIKCRWQNSLPADKDLQVETV